VRDAELVPSPERRQGAVGSKLCGWLMIDLTDRKLFTLWNVARFPDQAARVLAAAIFRVVNIEGGCLRGSFGQHASIATLDRPTRQAGTRLIAILMRDVWPATKACSSHPIRRYLWLSPSSDRSITL
jgi:hypothetical protein